MDKEIKVFTIKIGDEEKKVEVSKPTPKIEAEGNMAASKVFSKLLRQKDEDGKPEFIVRAQLNSFLANIGIYTEQDIEDINTFSDRIKVLEDLLSAGGKKKSEGRDAAIELRKLRFAIYSLLMKQSDYDKNTVEHYADNARMDYLVTKCICFEGGAPVFKSVEDYLSDDNIQVALGEPIQYLAGLVSQYDPDFEKKLPENKFLKKYNFCDEKYRLIDKNGNLIDGDGNRVDEDGNQVEKVDEPEAVGEFLDDDETDATKPPEESVEAPKEEVVVEDESTPQAV